MIDGATVKKLAQLTRIEIDKEEEQALVSDLESILDYVSDLSSVDSLSTGIVLGENVNIFREDDNAHPGGFYTDKILAGAPRKERGYILVKQVIGEKGVK